MTPAITYPAGPITKHGAYYLLKGTHPEVKLTAYDGSIVFYLMGGRAIPNRARPERADLKTLKGLIPPWQMVDQKGATQDGVTNLDALYDPIEVDATVMCRGRDAKRTRKVVRDLIASIDAKQTSELSWFTQELGKWWADVRWFKTPPDELLGAQKKRQQLLLTWRVDNAFWRTYDHVDQFRFAYQTAFDNFTTTTTKDLGDDWTVNYSGTGGGGYVRVVNGEMVWVDDPKHPILSDGRTMVARRAGATASDNQVIEITLGSFPQFSFPDNAYTDVWARMATTGTPGDTGIRLRLGFGQLILSYFVAGVETVLRTKLILPPLRGEKFSLVCGYESDSRMYKVLRGGAEIVTVKEGGTGSRLGADYRGRGAGMHAGGALIGQATPAAIRLWSAGDNSTVANTGFLTRMNIGDQPMPDRYTCYGPGLFKIADGPGSNTMIEFGPLLTGQVMQLRTDGEDRPVVDLTSVAPTPQDVKLYNKALEDFISFATANNAPPLLQKIESVFGIQPPQGNPLTLLKGRFSKGAAIPPKSPGYPAQPYHVACSIDDGTADSAIVASGTPLRRYPI